MTFYALRYHRRVPYENRPHAPTMGRWATAAEADAARRLTPNPDALEVVVRTVDT